MDNRKNNKILSMAGKIFLGERIERLALRYVINHPNITAEKLSQVTLIGKRIKIKSPTVAQYYIDIVKKYS